MGVSDYAQVYQVAYSVTLSKGRIPHKDLNMALGLGWHGPAVDCNPTTYRFDSCERLYAISPEVRGLTSAATWI